MTDGTEQVSIRSAVEQFAERALFMGVTPDELVSALVGVGATVTLAQIGAERTRQYFADVALHLLDD